VQGGHFRACHRFLPTVATFDPRDHSQRYEILTLAVVRSRR